MTTIFNEEIVKKFDSKEMRQKLYNMYKQFETEFEILNPKAAIKATGIQNIVITGMGGSAIGGDIIRIALSGESKIPITVNRNYSLPNYVGKDTLVIVSSYSGNTEETISAYKDAIKRKAKIVCITSGGEIEKLAKANKHYCVKIPGGLPPRVALGYSFAPQLQTLSKFGFIKDKTTELKETISHIRAKSAFYANVHVKGNHAIELARKLVGKMPVIYTGDDYTSVCGTRWKGQICENAKVLAYSNVFPEMNHNELVGWNLNDLLMKKIHVVMLHDSADHPRTTFRMNLTDKLISKHTGTLTHVHSEGASQLTRIFSLILLGDWVSYYLAIMNNVDPTPVKSIDFLKDALLQHKV